MNAILEALSEKVDIKILQKANTKALKKKLLKCFTDELFYKLLSEQRVDLAPGFGSFVLKDIREKDKKVFDKKTQAMVIKHVRGKKVVYKPGDIIREFL
jgi:nucleoid DNA-binding protein